MDKSLVTIAIASYNNSKYIGRCLESVLNQNYHKLEIIIVDDGSFDNTYETINYYKSDPRIKFIQKKNRGLSSARQLALDLAIGKYICFIDADDYLAESYISDMLDCLNRTKADICVCGTRFEDEDGNYLPEFSEMFLCHDCETPYQPTFSDINQYNNSRIGGLHISDSWNKMYNTTFLRKSQVKFGMTKGLNGTDEMFNRLLLIHRPLYSTLSKELYVHVMYNSSAVHRKSRNLIVSFSLIIDKMANECIKLDVLDKMEHFIGNYYVTSLYAAHLDILGDGGNDFGIIKDEDIKLKNKYPFLSAIKLKGISLNIVLFYFLYKRCNSLVPLCFMIRSFFVKR